MREKILKTAYVVVFLVICAVFGLMLLKTDTDTIGNEEKNSLEGVTYLNFSEKFDEYVSKGFGFRNELININNTLKYTIFNQSGENSVIAGKDGWLFYESALGDYDGTNVLENEEIGKLAKIIEIMSENIRLQGKEFVFVCAPNKMEIYGEYMPYYHKESEQDGNYEKLFDALKGTEASYVDLKQALLDKKSDTDVLLYHKLDSHWNSYGAWTAYESIMKHLELDYTDYCKKEYTIRKDFSGDLYAMLFPEGDKKDEQVYFDGDASFYYTGNFRGADDITIETECENGSKKLLMYRDSFGNALYGFFAEDFAKAEFNRTIPYDFTELSDTEVVVVELVERNLKNLLTMLPIIKAQEKVIDDNIVRLAGSAKGEISEKGDMILVTFKSDEIPKDCTEMYLQTPAGIYEAYPSAKDGDGCIYLDTSDVKNLSECNVIFRDADVYYSLEIS